MATINYKLNFCRITLASRLFARNNYFPLFKVLTPQDATREIIKNTFTPKNHYMPVLLSNKKRERLSAGKRFKDLKSYGKRLHSKIDDFKYMNVIFNFEDERHKKILDVLKNKKHVKGSFVYKIEERNTCLVFDGQLEEAVRNGDIADVTISDNADRMIMRLKTGEKISTEAQNFVLEEILFWGEAATTNDTESRHHYGKMIMSIAHIFEMKEKSAALYELEKIKFEAKKKQKVEREWKSGLEPLLENLIRENEANKENESNGSNDELHEIENTEYKMKIADINKTSNISDRLLSLGQNEIEKLPLMKEINRMIKRIGEGELTQLGDIPGVLVKVGDNERFLIGQMVQTEKDTIFVPGQTFETTNGVKYLPGITVNLDNSPTFVAGVIMADDSNSPVFLPGQSFITNEGTMRFTKEGERVTPVNMKKLQMTEDEQWERVEKRKLTRDKLEKEKMEKQKAEGKERKRAKKEKLDRKKAEKAKQEKQLQLTQSTIDNMLNNLGDQVRSNEGLDGFSVTPVVNPDNPDPPTSKEEVTKMDVDNSEEHFLIQESDQLKRFNEEILAGIFLQDHKHLVDEETIDRDREMMKAKILKTKQEEERKKNALIADDMKEVIDVLEMKKNKLLEKLRIIQNETSIFEDRAVTYIYPAKANALAVELGFDGQIARNIAKILLGITRWANTFSAKFHVHSENIDIVSYSSEIDEAFYNCSDNLKTALKASMVAAVEVFKHRPKDLEGGMKAAGKSLSESVEENGLIIHEIALTLENKTNSERNELFSATLKDLTKKLVVNKTETLRCIIREEFSEEKLVAKINLVIEEEGDILVRGFTNLTLKNPELCRKVYNNIINTASELLCEEKSGEAAHRAIVDAVQEMAELQLSRFLKNESNHSIKHLLSEAHTVADMLGLKNEAKTIDRLIHEEDELSVHVMATDQITLDILRRVLVIRDLAERNPQLSTGLALLRKEPYQARDDRNTRELVRESAALISHACPIISSLDIPSFLFELGNSLAMEDYLVQHIKRDGALLICKSGIQAVVPKEASRFVLSGLISYTLIDDKGVTYFKPMHVFNALKLGKAKERMYHDYRCVGAFDKYAYSVPVRQSLDYNYRNYLNTFYNNQCRDDVSNF